MNLRINSTFNSNSRDSNFKNVILIVVFNYADCVKNIDLLTKLYQNVFKNIIFYSDNPKIHHLTTGEYKNNEIHYIDINKGEYTQNIFKHFYDNYKSEIDESDGIFYTMDDNIINVNILNLFTNNKIIYFPPSLDKLENYHGWQWDEKMGKNYIYQMINDADFGQYNVSKYSGTFSDFFYLPKKYLSTKLFGMFDIFSKHKVFLELAIPSVIHNIEPDTTQYQCFTSDILWGDDRKKTKNTEYIHNSFNHKHDLFFHPIKLNNEPIYKQFLPKLLCKEKCVIITTINKPTEAILKHINNTEYNVIIVGDNKTPDDYKNLHCIYLDIASQKKLFPELSELLPYNHYCRKNLGYLYAIKKGYTIIYETDDDNIPYDNFDNVLQYNTSVKMITEQNNTWINIFKYFTNNAYIWPRGYPLSLLKTQQDYIFEETNNTPSIINGLVENDPDVDALFRIVCNHQDSIKWEMNKQVVISNKNVCVFNTQNTFWLNSYLFVSMLIPSSVSFRYCDILRGIICNIILKKTDNYMMYSSPNVIQNRNEHDLIQDFKSEIEMYIHNESILDFIDQDIVDQDDERFVDGNSGKKKYIEYLIKRIYQNLLDKNVIKQLDMDILNKWLEYFE